MMKLRYLAAHLLLPITRCELPGWGRIVKPLGLFSYRADHKWSGLPVQEIRGKLHGFRMSLDLGNWSQRMTWFLGRFYELDTQMAIQALVDRGDTVIDIGANIGMLSLLAAKQVGNEGEVLAFEPNPVAYGKLVGVIELNGIRNIKPMQIGLSDCESSSVLSVVGAHDGAGSLVEPSHDDLQLVTGRYEITTKVGDAMFGSLAPKGKVFIKIDVEGYEVRVLRGLAETIKIHRPIIMTEFEPNHLQRAGSSDKALVDLMRGYGYSPYVTVIKRKPIRYEFSLQKADSMQLLKSRNVVWRPDATIR